MDDRTSKPRFEPPPWEREAFERFHAEREVAEAEHAARRAERELDEALDTLRTGEEPSVASRTTEADADQAPEVAPARVEAMLAQLRVEEEPVRERSPIVANVVTALLATTGVAIMVQALLSLAGTRGSSGQGMMLAITVSFVMFAVGAGFLGAAVMLFRTYHR